MSLAEVRRACEGSPELKTLWLDLAIAASALIKGKMQAERDVSILQRTFAQTLARLRLAFEGCPLCTEWDILQLEQ